MFIHNLINECLRTICESLVQGYNLSIEDPVVQICNLNMAFGADESYCHDVVLFKNCLCCMQTSVADPDP
jgi:hypothetical protein